VDVASRAVNQKLYRPKTSDQVVDLPSKLIANYRIKLNQRWPVAQASPNGASPDVVADRGEK